MPEEVNQEPYILNQERNLAIFDRIKRNLFYKSVPSQNPQVIFLGGQSGSGKSSLATYLSDRLNQKEGSVLVNSDSLREYHPAFSALQKTNIDQASFLVNPDTIKWQQQLIAAAIKTKHNLLLDGTLGGNPAPILATIQLLHEAGYYIQVSVLAVPARLSRLGIYKRYEDQVVLKSAGRWVGMKTHNRQYDDIPKTLAMLEAETFNDGPVIDRIQVYARPTGLTPPALLYDNQLKNGQWDHPPLVAQALAEGRDRPWSSEENTVFTTTVEALAEQMRRRGVSEAGIDLFFVMSNGLFNLSHRTTRRCPTLFRLG